MCLPTSEKFCLKRGVDLEMHLDLQYDDRFGSPADRLSLLLDSTCSVDWDHSGTPSAESNLEAR